jgi:release factor glutamine methyltransferase
MKPDAIVGAHVGEVLGELTSRLRNIGDTPELDSLRLLSHILEKPSSWILAHTDASIEDGLLNLLDQHAARLEAGEPLPYVLGRWDFFNLEFELTQDVLIPRPETELLVELALSWLREHPLRRQVVDVGTGSGCIGISLAVNVADIHVVALDISPAALDIARLNAQKHAVDGRMDFVCSDLLSGNSKFDIIVANLPYIPTSTLHALTIYSHEPTLALDGGSDGMAINRRLLSEAADHLLPGGLLLMEMDSLQAPKLQSLAGELLPNSKIQIHKDLAGLDRVMEILFI